jgi:HD-like signal output (HDOD) protein
MSDSDVSMLLDQISHLPVMPKAIRELMAEFDRPETDVDKVVKLVGADPVLAVKLLRLANSSYYARRGTVDRLHDAVVFIGMHATRNLVMSVGLAASVGFPPGFPKALFWRYSLHSAVAARFLAAGVKRDPAAAFALGLMRAIGEPLVASVRPAELRQLDGACPLFDEARLAAEERSLGFNFVDVSIALARLWHFPAQLLDALHQSLHLEPAAPMAPLGAAVSVGAWIAGEHEAGRRVDHGVPDKIGERLRMARIPEQLLDDMPPLPQLAQGLEALVA